MHILARRSNLIRWTPALVVAAMTVCSLALLVGISGRDLATAQDAQETPQATELLNRSTATSRTYRLSDGTFETRLYETPVNYRDEKGDWQPIDQALRETASGSLTNGENGFDVHLPEDLDEAPVRVVLGEQWVSQVPLGINTEPAEFEDGVATYSTQGGGADIEFSGLANGLKETIELAGPSAPSTYHFRLEASAGVEPSLEADGSIEFRDEDSDLVAEVPAPIMVDAADAVASAGAVKYVLAPDGATGWRLTVEADPEWLSAPERSWPVIIDPSVTVSSPVADCIIATDTSAQMCGHLGFGYLASKAKYPTTGPDAFARTLLRFKVNSLPANASLTSATIGLYSAKTATNVTKVDLYDVNKIWSSSATWTNGWTIPGGDFGQEMPTPASVTTTTRGSEPGWWNFSSLGLLNLVSGWHENEDLAKKGVILKLADETPRVCCFERRVEWESSAGVSKPRLVVQYILPASADSKVISPTDGTKTAKRFVLKAGWDHSNVEGVTFQYKDGHMWSDIPAGQVIDEDGQSLSGWPYGVSIDDRESGPLYWNASSLADSKGKAKVKIRAVLWGAPGASGYTKPVEAELDQNGGGSKDATAPIGPGSVNLLTGNFTVLRTDVSISGFKSSLQFSRSISSRETSSEQSGVLGQGWKAGAPVEEAGGSSWRSLKIESFTEDFEGTTFTEKWATLVPIKGQTVSFEEGPSGNFATPPEMSGSVLYRDPATGNISLTDPDGNKTTFSNFGSGNEYWPISVSQTGGPGNKTRMIYAIEGSKRRLMTVIAPAADGIACGDEAATTSTGCRVLGFSYENAKEWGAPESLGARLAKITFYAPGHGGPWDVASFDYDSQGRLAAAWDPRISPTLKETYTYESDGQLKTITPPGQEPWTMTYGTISGEVTGGRLMSVKRPSLVESNPTAQTTIAYGVPTMKGSGGPYEMSPQEVSRWGQEDPPIDATAIFPPDEVPANPPSSYAHAAVYYMDPEGQIVNTAIPQGAGSSGDSISTTETDIFGNISRELTPENRLRALAMGTGSAAKSKEFDTQYKYSADGSVLLDERGPVHAVRLETGPEAGTIVQARSYRSVQYDKGAPEPKAGEPMPLLPTHETTGALVGGKVLDQHTVENTYDWILRQQTGSIADPEGLEIKSMTKYDEVTSLPIEVRQPKDVGTPGAGTTKIVYYTKDGSSGQCASKIYAGLPCKIEPASQPSTGPNLPITTYVSYSPLGQPTKVVEEVSSPTSASRTTTITYDSAGRPKTKHIQGGGGGSTQILKVEMLYSPTTGALETQRFVCPFLQPSCDKETITATTDSLGRVTGYQDADGNQATTTYDLNGRPATFNDGKGTQTYSYDAATGMLVSLTDSMAGIFTASYNADGQMIKRGLPNGLTAEAVYDAAGAATDLTYTKASNCGTSCTWLDFEVARSAGGKILSEAGTLGAKRYAYDAVGRLVTAEETPSGDGCITRSYGYDKNSNRTSLTTTAPGISGACSGSGGSTQSYSYDGADRLEAAGLTHDAFGRLTSLPSIYAGGGTLTTSYFSNDMVASQTQDGITNTFALDAALRQRQRVQAGGLEGVEVFHYAGPSDSPAWTQLGETWTRNITGVGGELVALAKHSGTPSLQLSNLHGDIVATTSINPSDTQMSFTARVDEFGKPASGTPGRFGWLGGAQRRTELPSGVIQMGARSYVPAMGRFLSTDPIRGGSANPYDYANQDPVNSLDLSGEKPHDRAQVGPCTGNLHVWSPKNYGGRSGYGKFFVRFKVNCGGPNPLYRVYVMKIRRQFLLGPGNNNRVIAETTNKPRFPGSAHWQGEWGNWNESEPATVFGCLNGIEYQYTYEVSLEWSDGNVSPGRPNGVLTLQAQEYCGHGPY